MCASILKYWREAATLMLVRRTKQLHNQLVDGVLPRLVDELLPSSAVSPTSVPSKSESPGLDLIPKSELELLVLKGSSKSSFMPDMCLFPGGMADDSDFSQKWLKLFDATTTEQIGSRFGFSKTVSQNAPMFHRQREKEFSLLPSEIAFRICAIRETFQESGVLIARSLGHKFIYQDDPDPTYSYVFGINHESQVEEWRHRVSAEPEQFLTLCEQFDIVPDIWTLYDWSNWLTPVLNTHKKGSKRFDAAFFICCLHDDPYLAHDEKLTIHTQWASPCQILRNYNRNHVQLAPPQLYEVSRLLNFATVDQLVEFLKSRVGQPLERCMPVRADCSDAIIFLLPGDFLYPEHPDYEGELPILQKTESLEELTPPSANLHRAVIGLPPGDPSVDNRHFELQCNIRLPYGHVTPYVQ